MSRRFDAIFDIVEKLDVKSLAEKRPISRGMAASILCSSID